MLLPRLLTVVPANNHRNGRWASGLSENGMHPNLFR